jgi:peptidyl-prolyl cis-trans isomerase C
MRASTLVALGLGLSLSAWQAHPVHADASVAETTIVAKVGTRRVTVDELNRRIAALPPFQLRSFGRSADEVRKNFLERVVIREALLAQGALDSKLAERSDVAERIRGVLQSAMLARARADVLRDSPVTDAEVKQYYDANPTKFHAPVRIAISRIEVAKREEAAAIIKDFQADPSAKRWLELARDKSLDKATALRGGNLGFVSPDGSTDEAGLKVDRAILTAVATVEDGKLVPEPVQEGERYAVVWRRQSMRAVDRPLALEAPSIRQVLTHEKTEARAAALLTQLRKDHLREFSPDLIELFDVTPTGDLHAVRRGGTLSPRKSSAPPAPIPVHGGALR